MNQDNTPVQQQRGRPSQFALVPVANLPIKVTGFVLGDVTKMRKEEIAEKIDECIVRNSRQSKKCQTNVAMALYVSRTTGTFRDSGYRSWEDYIKAMVIRHQSFTSSKQADRYVHSVQTWIINNGFEPALLEKYGPSLLGEIAQAGMVKNAQDAQAWIRLLESRTPLEIRGEIKNQRNQLEAPVGDDKQLHEFNPVEGVATVATGAGAAPAAVQPEIIHPEDQCEYPFPEDEDDGVTDAEPVPLPPGVTVYPGGQQATAEPATPQADTLTIEIIEAKDPSGKTYFTVFIRRNGQVCERYTSNARPRVRELCEDDASDLGREKRNVRVEDVLRQTLSGEAPAG